MADPLNAPPSVDPANQDSLEGAFAAINKKQLQGIDDMLPARVVSYDRTTNRATVVPMIAMLTTAGAQVARAQIASVPVLMVGGGGVMLSFNLKAGDLGWIKANDRDISLFAQNAAAGPPNTHRMHSFEDALFIPDAFRGFTIKPEDSERAVLQSLDGTVRIALGVDVIKLTNGTNSVTVGPAGTVVTGPLIINGIVFNTHVHGGVQPGGGTTGIPT